VWFRRDVWIGALVGFLGLRALWVRGCGVFFCGGLGRAGMIVCPY
jgi:hypothetical protein